LSKDYTEDILTPNVKAILGVNFNAPFHIKLLHNMTIKNPKIAVDINYLLLQHNTTGYKLGVAAFYLKQIKELSDFYTSSKVDGKGIYQFEANVFKQTHFTMSLENFFVSCWAGIISICRELWRIYNLNLDSKSRP
jgi:hypothetical protein